MDDLNFRHRPCLQRTLFVRPWKERLIEVQPEGILDFLEARMLPPSLCRAVRREMDFRIRQRGTQGFFFFL